MYLYTESSCGLYFGGIVINIQYNDLNKYQMFCFGLKMKPLIYLKAMSNETKEPGEGKLNLVNYGNRLACDVIKP